VTQNPLATKFLGHLTSIESGELLDGEIPGGKLKLVQAWIEIHREDLMADWELSINNELPLKMAPPSAAGTTTTVAKNGGVGTGISGACSQGKVWEG
jgi:hypothetical protein